MKIKVDNMSKYTEYSFNAEISIEEMKDIFNSLADSTDFDVIIETETSAISFSNKKIQSCSYDGTNALFVFEDVTAVDILKSQMDMLTDCVLEMSETVYAG